MQCDETLGYEKTLRESAHEQTISCDGGRCGFGAYGTAQGHLAASHIHSTRPLQHGQMPIKASKIAQKLNRLWCIVIHNIILTHRCGRNANEDARRSPDAGRAAPAKTCERLGHSHDDVRDMILPGPTTVTTHHPTSFTASCKKL